MKNPGELILRGKNRFRRSFVELQPALCRLDEQTLHFLFILVHEDLPEIFDTVHELIDFIEQDVLV